jgi:cyclophilin family peptidyl-prolyl cis-trans isomerase/HEAT repeat protein
LAEDSVRSLEPAEIHRQLAPELVSALDAPPAIAARAALAIGRTKLSAGAPPLRAHLTASDVSVRAMVAYALGLLDDAPSLAALRELARHDPNSAVRYAAVDAVGRIVQGDALTTTFDVAQDLLIVARADSDPLVRGHAVAQLGPFHTSPFGADIAHAIERIERRDADPGVRWHAAWMLFRGYATLADPAFLTRALQSHDELVRVETLRAWGRRSDAGAPALIRPLLGDPSWRVQFEAIEALKRLAKTPPTEHLTADPPGIHLPPIPPVAEFTPRPLPSPSDKPAPPDPTVFPLGAPMLPKTAADLDGPLPGLHPRVRIRTTQGDVIVRLYPEWAPSTVANFLTLTERGYFDGGRWFRIVPDFVDQTGDPTNTGDGDAGYTIPAEENPVEQRTGIIAMGLDYKDNLPLRDSAGTQFYFTLSPQLHLDRDFSVFGEVESGFGVLAHLVESDKMVVVERIADD